MKSSELENISIDSQKGKNLERSYERIINVGFCLIPYEDLSDTFAENPVIFGTTKDEIIFSFEGVRELFKSQFEQMKGMKPSLTRNRIAKHISPDGNSAFIVEENTLSLSSPEEVNSIFMRISCVMEYIDNGWKLTGDRGPTTDENYKPKLRVRTFSDNATVTIKIEDNGPGIPDEIKEKILQPFFTTKKGTQGTGLGLSITNDIVKAHGGSLTICDSNENGTTFKIALGVF